MTFNVQTLTCWEVSAFFMKVLFSFPFITLIALSASSYHFLQNLISDPAAMGGKKEVTMKLEVNLQCCKCYKKVKKVLCKFPQIRDQVFDKKEGIVKIKVVCCDPEKLRDKLCCKGGGSIKSIEIVEPKPPVPEPTPKPPRPVPPAAHPLPPVCVPVRICCGPCYEGRPGGPCYEGHGRPPICCDGYYGWPVYDSYGGYRLCCCDQYFSDENPQACTVM